VEYVNGWQLHTTKDKPRPHGWFFFCLYRDLDSIGNWFPEQSYYILALEVLIRRDRAAPCFSSFRIILNLSYPGHQGILLWPVSAPHNTTSRLPCGPYVPPRGSWPLFGWSFPVWYSCLPANFQKVHRFSTNAGVILVS